MNTNRRRSFTFLAFFLCGACSGSAPAPNDAATGVDAPSGSLDAGSGDLCANIPMNDAATITDSVMSVPFPGASATGGAIESGTYHQTQHVYYQPASTPTHTWSAVMVIDASAGTIVTNVSRDGAVFQQMGDTYTTSGNTLQLSITCPASLAGTSASFTYTYEGGTLTIFAEADQTATVFERQ